MQDNKVWMQPDRIFDHLADSDHSGSVVPAVKRPSVITMNRVSSSYKLMEAVDAPKPHDDDESQTTPPWRVLLKHKLFFVLDMIWGVDIIVVFTLTLAVTLAVNHLGPTTSVDGKQGWFTHLSESKPAIATLGAFYSFALVFRTNICYARWWEGRTLWGTLIVNAIRITQQGRLWIDDETIVDRLHCMAITFAYACKAQLRGNSIKNKVEDGANLVRRGVLAQEELDMIGKQTAWQPYYCIDAMRAVMNEGLLLNNNQHHPDWRLQSAHQAMENSIAKLSSTIGGCIRVKSTGLPVAYDDILNAMGCIFFLAAILAWAPGVGLYNPIIVLVAYVIVKMIVGLGNDMEDPFGHDESDLPLEKFCVTIEKQINAIDERAHMIPYNLAYGPNKFTSAPPSREGSLGYDIEVGVTESTPLVTTNGH